MFELAGLLNTWLPGEWPREAGGVPIRPSYARDPLAVLVRLQWDDGRTLWVPGHASRWNREFVHVTVTPIEGDRRTETGLWLHHIDVARELPAERSMAPLPPDSRAMREHRKLHQRYPHGIPSLHAR